MVNEAPTDLTENIPIGFINLAGLVNFTNPSTEFLIHAVSPPIFCFNVPVCFVRRKVSPKPPSKSFSLINILIRSSSQSSLFFILSQQI
ncbi:hypothetical protein L1987_22850 [Smallanthus sonchifolius]|uniref:Uncharacterized protein n=1 Tax=Smallanthus sonchifolius TaxID=185202 RepID=A0ACB9IFT6_9ASTR|nr:hypothetical protein L1987_22850 [Smallanthus sonchifolius]